MRNVSLLLIAAWASPAAGTPTVVAGTIVGESNFDSSGSPSTLFDPATFFDLGPSDDHPPVAVFPTIVDGPTGFFRIRHGEPEIRFIDDIAMLVTPAYLGFDKVFLTEFDLWFVVEEGQRFDKSRIESGHFRSRAITEDSEIEIEFRSPFGSPPSPGPFDLTLAYAINDGPVLDGAGIEPLDLIQFGWVNLTIPVFGSSDQIVVASGAVLGGSGIVVGTLEAIPEPSAAGLISLATLAFGGRRTRS